MTIKYSKPSLWTTTLKNFSDKQHNMNETLRKMGVKKKIKLTEAIDAISRKQTYFNDRELIRLTNRSWRKRNAK